MAGVDWRALVRAEFPIAARLTYLDRRNPLFVCRRAVEEAQRYYAEAAAAPHLAGRWNDEIERVRGRVAALLGAGPEEIAFHADSARLESHVASCSAAEVPIIDLSRDFGMIPANARKGAVQFVTAHGVKAVYTPGDLRAPGASERSVAESRNIAGILALGGCLDVLLEAGLDAAASRVADLGDRVRASLTQRGMAVAGVDGRTTVVRVPRPHAVQEALVDCGVVVSAEADGVGVSVHLFTRDEDVERFVTAFDGVRRGERIGTPAPPPRPFVCVDLNGVLDAYEGWRGAEHWDPPAPGAREFLATLRARGCRVALFTTRYYRDAWRWLETHGLAGFVDEVTDRKPAADVFLDDHAVPFGGDYEEALRRVEQFTPHWRRAPREAVARTRRGRA